MIIVFCSFLTGIPTETIQELEKGSEVKMCGILTGYLGESLRLGGAANLRIVELSCRTAGSDVCNWSAEWDA